MNMKTSDVASSDLSPDGVRKVRMSDKHSQDKDGQPETCWDIGIRALIRGNVHHEADGASLHGGDSKQHDPAQPGEAGTVERPSGEDRARRRRQIRGVASGRKRRSAS